MGCGERLLLLVFYQAAILYNQYEILAFKCMRKKSPVFRFSGDSLIVNGFHLTTADSGPV